MSVNRDYIRAKNRAAYNFNSHQLEQLFATTQVGGKFHDTVFNNNHHRANKRIDNAIFLLPATKPREFKGACHPTIILGYYSFCTD